MSTEELIKVPVPMDESGKLDIMRFATAVVKSTEMKRWKDVGAVLLAMKAGQEMGMSQSAALSNLYVVNGKVSIEGSALRGVIRSSGVLAKGTDFDVFWLIDGELYPEGKRETIARLEQVKSQPLKDWPDSFGCLVEARREGWKEAKASSFTITDAKGARLWNAKDVWKSYPLDMLEWRATSRWGKRYAGDITVGGLHTIEEIQSIDVGPVEARVAPTEPDPLMATLESEVEVEAESDEPTLSASMMGACPECGKVHKPSEGCP